MCKIPLEKFKTIKPTRNRQTIVFTVNILREENLNGTRNNKLIFLNIFLLNVNFLLNSKNSFKPRFSAKYGTVFFQKKDTQEKDEKIVKINNNDNNNDMHLLSR